MFGVRTLLRTQKNILYSYTFEMCVSFFWHFVFGKVINSKDLKQLERRAMFAHY